MIKQTIDCSYSEFSVENKNDPYQAVSFLEKNLWAVFFNEYIFATSFDEKNKKKIHTMIIS